jgi:hypothetical protein
MSITRNQAILRLNQLTDAGVPVGEYGLDIEGPVKLPGGDWGLRLKWAGAPICLPDVFDIRPGGAISADPQAASYRAYPWPTVVAFLDALLWLGPETVADILDR